MIPSNPTGEGSSTRISNYPKVLGLYGFKNNQSDQLRKVLKDLVVPAITAAYADLVDLEKTVTAKDYKVGTAVNKTSLQVALMFGGGAELPPNLVTKVKDVIGSINVGLKGSLTFQSYDSLTWWEEREWKVDKDSGTIQASAVPKEWRKENPRKYEGAPDIILYKQFFDLSPELQARTIIHELSHVEAGTLDLGYVKNPLGYKTKGVRGDEVIPTYEYKGGMPRSQGYNVKTKTYESPVSYMAPPDSLVNADTYAEYVYRYYIQKKTP